MGVDQAASNIYNSTLKQTFVKFLSIRIWFVQVLTFNLEGVESGVLNSDDVPGNEGLNGENDRSTSDTDAKNFVVLLKNQLISKLNRIILQNKSQMLNMDMRKLKSITLNKGKRNKIFIFFLYC